VVILCGCRQYEYRLLQPVQQVIGKQTVTVPYEPLEYRLTIRDDYLDMRVVNPTDDRVTLLTPKSYVVSPASETHPLRGRTIAPHSFVGMTLPPVIKVYHAGYPAFSFGFGYGVYHPAGHAYSHYGFYDPFFYAPPPIYSEGTAYGWDWKTGEVRVRLEYERAGKNFVHDLVFERRRVK